MFVLFVLLSKKALSLQDSSSYFSVMVFGRLVVLVKRQMDAFLVSICADFKIFSLQLCSQQHYFSIIFITTFRTASHTS